MEKIVALLLLVIASCTSGDDGTILIFDGFNLANVPGVTPINGFLNNSPAYRFSKTVNDLISEANATRVFAEKINLAKVFIISGYARTNKTYEAPVLSLSLGTGPTNITAVSFGVDFGWKSYTSGDAAVTLSVTFRSSGNPDSYKKVVKLDKSVVAKKDWVFFSVMVHKNENLVRFKVNDKFFEHIGTSTMEDLSPSGNLRIAQKLTGTGESGSNLNHFEGDLQKITLTFGSCFEVPVLPTNIPTTMSAKTTNSPLPTTVVVPTTSSSDSKGQCVAKDGSKHKNGHTWDEECKTCSCETGTITCFKNCNLNVCIQDGKAYMNGAEWFDSSCQKCRCKNNRITCKSTLRKKKTGGCERTCSDYSSSGCPRPVKDGCFCPNNMVSDNGKCVSRVSCGCTVNGKKMKSGEYVMESNQICFCTGGSYSCTKLD